MISLKTAPESVGVVQQPGVEVEAHDGRDGALVPHVRYPSAVGHVRDDYVEGVPRHGVLLFNVHSHLGTRQHARGVWSSGDIRGTPSGRPMGI